MLGTPEAERGKRGSDVGRTDGGHAAAANQVEIFVVPGPLVRVHDGRGPARPHDMSAGQVVPAPDAVALALVKDVAVVAGIVAGEVLDAQAPEDQPG